MTQPRANGFIISFGSIVGVFGGINCEFDLGADTKGLEHHEVALTTPRECRSGFLEMTYFQD
jgi:hypothetical protein